MCGYREDGYVALLSVLIVGAVAVAVGTMLLMIGLDSQRAALVTQRSLQARGLASTCAEDALQQIHDDTSYTGNNTLNLGQGSCTYTVTNTGGANRTIAASGTVGTVVRRASLSITIGSTITITSWQEVQ